MIAMNNMAQTEQWFEFRQHMAAEINAVGLG